MSGGGGVSKAWESLDEGKHNDGELVCVCCTAKVSGRDRNGCVIQ